MAGVREDVARKGGRVKPSASPEYKREYSRKWREANREKAREYARNYYRSNKEKLCAYYRERWQRNPEKHNAKKNEWRAKQDQERLKELQRERQNRYRSKAENREADIIRSREYKEQHKERIRKWRQENEIVAANDNYVRHLLKFKKSDGVPVELIKAKREHLKLTRKLKNK